MGDVVEFIVTDVFELLAAGLEFFVDLDGFLGHHLVRFRRAADEREIRPGRQPFVTVGIKTDAEHYCLAFFLLGRVRHEFKLKAVAIAVKPPVVSPKRPLLFALRTGAVGNSHVPYLTEREHSLQCFGLRKTILINMRFEFHE